jgi:DNA-binding CsgD family transcriptional regulator
MKSEVASPPNFPRARLVRWVLRRSEPIVLIAATAGMGKSALLEKIAAQCGVAVRRGREPPTVANAQGPALWDIPPGCKPRALPELFVSGEVRLIVAKRPEHALVGLDRAIAYGRVASVGDNELRLSEDEIAAVVGSERARKLIAATGGWPALVAACLSPRRAEAAAAAYCFREMFRGYRDEALVACDGELSAATSQRRGLLPLGPLRDIEAAAVREEIDRRAAAPRRAHKLAAAYAQAGQVPEAVRALQRADLQDEALAAFVAAGGWTFTFHYGPGAFDAALAGFAQPLRQQSEPLVLALAFQALKQGDVARARRLLVERFGPASRDPARVFAPGSAFSANFRCFYFVMMLYEGLTPDEALQERAFATLSEFPTNADLPRGSFYNAALEFYIRENRFAEAEDLAQRALFHYERAGVAILSFYIRVHLTVIRLNMGDVTTARGHCDAARDWFQRVPYDTPSDGRILALLDACVHYESGQAEALISFLLRDIDRFTLGETWPSLVELAVQYGAQALGEYYSTRAALAFVGRWRMHDLTSRTLRLAIELREAAILQNANRWDEAEEALAAASSKVSRERILGGTVDLARLREREPMLCALAWMRQIAFRSPKTSGLERRLAALRDNLALSPRQRVSVEIWLAYVWRVKRDLGRARTALKSLFETAAQTGALAPIAGERIFVAELLAQRQIVAFVETSPQARQTLRKLRDVGYAPSPSAARLGLTRQETKLLLMACRGATNKDAANALGVSEATVKFHLGNAYRKLGCRRRSEATAAAHSLGLIR